MAVFDATAGVEALGVFVVAALLSTQLAVPLTRLQPATDLDDAIVAGFHCTPEDLQVGATAGHGRQGGRQVEPAAAGGQAGALGWCECIHADPVEIAGVAPGGLTLQRRTRRERTGPQHETQGVAKTL